MNSVQDIKQDVTCVLMDTTPQECSSEMVANMLRHMNVYKHVEQFLVIR